MWPNFALRETQSFAAWKRNLIPSIFMLLVLAFSSGIPSSFDSALAASPEKSELPEISLIINRAYFVSPDGSDDGPGSTEHPWATINHAAERAEAGDTVIIRGGLYVLSAQVRPRHSGQPNAWITFMGYPGERPILDAQALPYSSLRSKGLDNGAFQIESVAYIRVANLSIINSHDAGITIRESSNIDLINNSTKGTFSSGIAAWGKHDDDKATAQQLVPCLCIRQRIAPARSMPTPTCRRRWSRNRSMARPLGRRRWKG